MARVLIFEPHADIAALLEVVVRRLGHEPVLARDAAGELEDYDAAVVEPGNREGLALARRLHAAQTPVIFTSIFPADRELLALGPVRYLVKPFSLYELESALGTAVSARRHASAGQITLAR